MTKISREILVLNSHQMEFLKVPNYLILTGAYLHLHEPKRHKEIHPLIIIRCIRKPSKACK